MNKNLFDVKYNRNSNNLNLGSSESKEIFFEKIANDIEDEDVNSDSQSNDSSFDNYIEKQFNLDENCENENDFEAFKLKFNSKFYGKIKNELDLKYKCYPNNNCKDHTIDYNDAYYKDLKNKFDDNYSVNMEEYKDKLKENFEKRRLEFENSNKNRIEETKIQLIENEKKKFDKLCDESLAIIKKKENEIKLLKEKLDKLPRTTESPSYPILNNYDDELKKIESEYEIILNNKKSLLELNLKEKTLKLKSTNYEKKIQYENSLSSNKLNRNNSENPSNIQVSNDYILKKNQINKLHELKVEQQKEAMSFKYLKSLEIEKDSIIKFHKHQLCRLKEKSDELKIFYNEQLLHFNTELTIFSSSNLNGKLKSILENKNKIFKNLFDQIYLRIRKKIREIENLKDINSMSELSSQGKEIIFNKITDLLSNIFYENIYDYLHMDISFDIEIINSKLEDLIGKFEQIISKLNFEKKVQLSVIVSNPNFNI